MILKGSFFWVWILQELLLKFSWYHLHTVLVGLWQRVCGWISAKMSTLKNWGQFAVVLTSLRTWIGQCSQPGFNEDNVQILRENVKAHISRAHGRCRWNSLLAQHLNIFMNRWRFESTMPTSASVWSFMSLCCLSIQLFETFENIKCLEIILEYQMLLFCSLPTLPCTVETF